MEIRWSLPAADDLERICAWIERDNPEAAKRVVKGLSQHRTRQPPHERTARTGVPAPALHRRVSGEGTRG